MNMFGFGGGNSSSNQDAAIQQEKEFGPSWQAQVTDNDNVVDSSPSSNSTSSSIPHWKPLSDWKAVYEPPPSQQHQQQSASSCSSAAQSYLAGKAKQLLLRKMQTSVTSKIFVLTQETASHVLTLAEAQATANAKTSGSNHTDDNDKQLPPNNNNNDATAVKTSTTAPPTEAAVTEAWQVLAELLNNMNAIVLTFRFENTNNSSSRTTSNKCVYLRNVACRAIAVLLQQNVFLTIDNVYARTHHLDDVKAKVLRVLDMQQEHVQSFVADSLNDSLQEAATNAQARTAETLATAKSNLLRVEDAVASSLEQQPLNDQNTSSTVAATAPVTSNKNNDNSDDDDNDKQRQAQEIQRLEENIGQKQNDIKDESIELVADCIRLLVLKRMAHLTRVMGDAVLELLNVIQGLYEQQTELQWTQAQLQAKVLELVESLHGKFHQNVSLLVQRAVDMLGAVMDDNDESNGGDDAS